MVPVLLIKLNFYNLCRYKLILWHDLDHKTFKQALSLNSLLVNEFKWHSCKIKSTRRCGCNRP